MNFTLTAIIENFGKEGGWVGHIESMKGLVVHGLTPEETCKELITSLKVKFAHDFGVPASEIQEISEEEWVQLKREMALSGTPDKISRNLNFTLTKQRELIA